MPFRYFLLRGTIVVGTIWSLLAVVWGFYAQSLSQGMGFFAGTWLGVGLVWILYGLGKFCLWLRRKQTEGDA